MEMVRLELNFEYYSINFSIQLLSCYLHRSVCIGKVLQPTILTQVFLVFFCLPANAENVASSRFLLHNAYAEPLRHRPRI